MAAIPLNFGEAPGTQVAHVQETLKPFKHIPCSPPHVTQQIHYYSWRNMRNNYVVSAGEPPNVLKCV